MNANRMKLSLKNIQICLKHVFLLEQLKNYWCGQNVTQKVEQLYTVSSPCLDDHKFKQEELESVGEFSQVCSQFVLKCLYLARIGRSDILWLVNKLAGQETIPSIARKREFEQLLYVDNVPNKTHSSQGESQLYNFF